MIQQSYFWVYTRKKCKQDNEKIFVLPFMFIASLFTVAKIWKQTKCPSIDEWIKNM